MKESSMPCPLCEEYRLKYPLVQDEDGPVHVLEVDENGCKTLSDPIECAFEKTDVFSPDNWCCQTMSLLRKVFWSDQLPSTWHNDGNVGVIPIPLTDDPEEECGIQQGMLVMSWYKSRGRTGQAIIMNDDDEPRKLNLKTAQFIIREMRLQ